jgi:glycosyltransferase involved in cell wall biosynthesis
MKVAFVIHSNIFKKVDGMTNYYRRLCSSAAAHRHRIDIFMQDDGAERQKRKKRIRFFFAKVNSSFQPLPNAFLSLSPIFFIKLLWYFHGIFKDRKYDSVQISSAHPLCFAAALVAKRLNIPVVGSYHTRLPEYVPYWAREKFKFFLLKHLMTKSLSSFVKFWTRLVYGSADLIIAPTSRMKDALAIQFPRTAIAVIGRGVNSDLFIPREKKNAKLKILYAGRVSVEKNLEKLSFLNHHEDIELTIVGDGGDLERIKQVLPFASFKGAMQNGKLAYEYGISDIFVFPSVTDAYANVVSEALSAGLPVVAKPDCGVVGIGVRRIDSLEELNDILEIMPCDYMLQEFCDYPLEYGIFYCRYPSHEKGRVVSLTQKLIPVVIGDGRRSVRELIDVTPDIKYNKPNLLAHVKTLEHVPENGEHYQVINQASHTYGCVFRDNNHEITPEMDAWVNAMGSKASEFYFGRFDMKIRDKDSLRTGKGAKICELNGCWSEPAHIYDDGHTLGYAIKEMVRSYRRAYKIAKLNKKRLKMNVSYREIIDAYRSYMQEKVEILKVVG